jgi:cytochrome c-type protein NapB
MKLSVLIGAATVALGVSLSAAAVQDVAIPDGDLGLIKTSVFDNPAPPLVKWSNKDPGTATRRAHRSYDTAPPMITHTTKGMLPITRDSNTCKDCHMQPDLIGQKTTPEMPVPIPASHYVDVKKGELNMARWNCDQCHREQANVKPLVANNFGQRHGTGK